MEESPDAFEVDASGFAFLKNATAPRDVLLRGAQACPVQAIRLFDAATGRQEFP